MNLDYLAMNVTGFTFYSFYCTYGYFFDGVKSTGIVDLNDLLFAYHALGITLMTVVQACIYPRGENKLMKKTITMLILMWAFCIFYGALTMVPSYSTSGILVLHTATPPEPALHNGLPQTLHIFLEIPPSVGMELEKKIHSRLEYLQYCVGFHGRTVLVLADGHGKSKWKAFGYQSGEIGAEYGVYGL